MSKAKQHYLHYNSFLSLFGQHCFYGAEKPARERESGGRMDVLITSVPHSTTMEIVYCPSKGLEKPSEQTTTRDWGKFRYWGHFSDHIQGLRGEGWLGGCFGVIVRGKWLNCRLQYMAIIIIGLPKGHNVYCVQKAYDGLARERQRTECPSI